MGASKPLKLLSLEMNMQGEVSAAVTSVAERTFEVRASCTATPRFCAYIPASAVRCAETHAFHFLHSARQIRTCYFQTTQMQHGGTEVKMKALLHSLPQWSAQLSNTAASSESGRVLWQTTPIGGSAKSKQLLHMVRLWELDGRALECAGC